MKSSHHMHVICFCSSPGLYACQYVNLYFKVAHIYVIVYFTIMLTATSVLQDSFDDMESDLSV